MWAVSLFNVHREQKQQPRNGVCENTAIWSENNLVTYNHHKRKTTQNSEIFRHPNKIVSFQVQLNIMSVSNEVTTTDRCNGWPKCFLYNDMIWTKLWWQIKISLIPTDTFSINYIPVMHYSVKVTCQTEQLISCAGKQEFRLNLTHIPNMKAILSIHEWDESPCRIHIVLYIA